MTQYLSYVYAYLRPDGSPYYIGKGKGNRAYSNNHSIAVPKDMSRIVFMETNLSDIGALTLERRYIRWYGRKDINTGILRNMTDGGDGGNGINRNGRIFSDEHKRKLSESKRGINHPLYGKNHTEESKKKMREIKLGKICPEDARRKIGEANRGNKNYMYGRKHSEETKEKMRMAKRRLILS